MPKAIRATEDLTYKRQDFWADDMNKQLNSVRTFRALCLKTTVGRPCAGP